MKSFFAVVLLSLLVSNCVAGDIKKASEANIKTAYIYNFVRYVSWKKEDSVFTICVHQKSDLLDSLTGLEKKSVKGNPIKVVSINDINDINDCDTLVFPEIEKKELVEFMLYANNENILTVSDVPGYAKLGVMISLIKLDKKMSFEVNLLKLNGAELKMNANLLKLSHKVYQ